MLKTGFITQGLGFIDCNSDIKKKAWCDKYSDSSKWHLQDMRIRMNQISIIILSS